MESVLTRAPFGALPDGTPVEVLTLRDGAYACEILTYGGAIRALTVPDRSGRPVDVALGFDTLEDYLRQDKFLGGPHRPVRQPHRRRFLLPQRRGLPPPGQRRPQPPPRRSGRL